MRNQDDIINHDEEVIKEEFLERENEKNRHRQRREIEKMKKKQGTPPVKEKSSYIL